MSDGVYQKILKCLGHVKRPSEVRLRRKVYEYDVACMRVEQTMLLMV